MSANSPDPKSWCSWNVEELSLWLKGQGVTESVVGILKDEKVEGKHIPHVTMEMLMVKKIMFKDCLQIQEMFEKLQQKHLKSNQMKIYNDPIHGHIEVNPACQAIIDTPIFQRLRFLKQLGMVYYIYPGAAHNRFEHSLGVYHLAGKFVRQLQQNHPEHDITDVDVLCVEIAALCHDLGHGPFSHMFDSIFLKEVNKGQHNHEKVSVQLIDEIDKLVDLTNFGLKSVDISFIKELIGGPLEVSGSQGWPYVGRDEEKSFLYEIVCNKRNGNDVNTWDYLARDCHHLGFNNNFDYNRFLMFARVIEEDGEVQICIRDKEIPNLYNMFYTRYTLHKYAYHHKVNFGLEIMLTDVLKLADKHMTFTGSDGKELSISECIEDMKAYIELNDNILFKILHHNVLEEHPQKRDDLEKAKEIINRMFRRDLYTCVWESPPILSQLRSRKKFLEEEVGAIISKHYEEKNLKNNDDYVVQALFLDFGMKSENPVERLKVFSKRTPNQARYFTKAECSNILRPVTFDEMHVRVYSKTSDHVRRQTVTEACLAWYKVWQETQDRQKKHEEEEMVSDIQQLIQEQFVDRQQDDVIKLAQNIYKKFKPLFKS
ncbi:deoxynucleoside triphosphate triphosphohydrolase SAMHD1-like [Physella acuta]|uniref:deoxynucleoside triphosphate triphosphohydrolase SAMHD1-like n=1 Tax=Physella acuta TaxID=109671 RepID=UPI0027DBCB75|nr:deoxynucleoside triphosphate triphosphohydrolase SAMHD1-like [Physella acuta]